jgi:hypothetical protein
MTVLQFCLEYLHRHPSELSHLEADAIAEMIACALIMNEDR